jgi:hypothetical protein
MVRTSTMTTAMAISPSVMAAVVTLCATAQLTSWGWNQWAEGDAEIPDWGAAQVSGGELPGSLAGGHGGGPVHAVGAGRDRVAARVVSGRHAGVDDDLPGPDRPAEVDLQVLAGGLGGAGGVAGAGVAVHRVGRHITGQPDGERGR